MSTIDQALIRESQPATETDVLTAERRRQHKWLCVLDRIWWSVIVCRPVASTSTTAGSTTHHTWRRLRPTATVDLGRREGVTIIGAVLRCRRPLRTPGSGIITGHSTTDSPTRADRGKPAAKVGRSCNDCFL